jgi:hypothetical protein
MRNVKRSLSGRVTAFNGEYEWRLYREPQWCTMDGWKGLAVAVKHVEGQREAILEWPMPSLTSKSVPSRQRPQISRAMLEQGIATALEAGWEPLSRGRPFTITLS